MVREIKESDWKLLRQLHSVALERFCQRVLVEIERIASKSAGSHHERYLKIYKLIHNRDKEMGHAFDNPRRSNAFIQLATLKGLQLLTDEEFSRFSLETREAVELILGSRRA
jgi:hypothetical protein